MKIAIVDKHGDLVGFGEKQETTLRAFNVKFINYHNDITIHPKGFPEEKLPFSYSPEFTPEEIWRDVICHLLTIRASRYGFTVCSQIDWRF